MSYWEQLFSKKVKQSSTSRKTANLKIVSAQTQQDPAPEMAVSENAPWELNKQVQRSSGAKHKKAHALMQNTTQLLSAK